MNDKIKLDLLGITYNQIESGVYAVILEDAESKRRIPIIIGTAEAQSIECKLQNVITPRPLTHDLMVNVMRAYGLQLEEVQLYRMPNGVFAADLLLNDGNRELKIDSRSSDAIALAIRYGAPIYTDAKTIEEAGFDPGKKSQSQFMSEESQLEERPKEEQKKSLAQLSVEALESEMKLAVDDERYEDAAKIKEELERRKNPEE